jgi:hypothetical protein
MIFWREKEKKNCASRFEAKKAAMGDETVRGEPPRGLTTVPERAILFWLFREINGDKVATILVFKSADNLQGNIVGRDSGILPTIALIMCADF